MKKIRDSVELVWGCAAIAKIIGKTEAATFYMLSQGDLPAKKVGARWVAERSKLIAFFKGDAA